MTTAYAAKADIDTGNDTTGLGSNISDGEIWCSASIDNGTNGYDDAQVGGFIDTTGTSGTISIFAFASADDGTTYSGGATGTAGETSSVNLSEMELLGVVEVDAAGVYEFGPYSIAGAFGYVPEDWGIAVLNSSGAALDAVAGTDLHYKGITLS